MKNAFYLRNGYELREEKTRLRCLSSWTSSSQEEHEAVQEMTVTAGLDDLAPVMTHENQRTEARHQQFPQKIAVAKCDVSGYPYLATLG
jgi:hypothetical protein